MVLRRSSWPSISTVFPLLAHFFSDSDQEVHFLAIARGSLYETVTQLELAKELGYLGGDSRSRPTLDEIYSLAGEVSRM